MDPEFWLQRWTDNLIGFHQRDVNPLLQQYWPKLAGAGEACVFVPLCGKSLDMLWLAQRASVIGVEVSPLAVADFFRENRLAAEQVDAGPFQSYRAERLHLLCGDYFDLEPVHLENVNSVYDRAALIALPAPLRATYVEQLNRILPAGVRMLLITLAYDQSEMNGPPFAVHESEVHALFGGRWSIEKLAEVDVLAKEAKFRERGLSTLDEQVYLLHKQ